MINITDVSADYAAPLYKNGVGSGGKERQGQRLDQDESKDMKKSSLFWSVTRRRVII
jgi:hypothetical protein